MSSRRDFIRLAAGTTAWLLLDGVGCGRSTSGRKNSKDADTSVKAQRPRYFVQLLLSGGHDTVYTTDPKTRGEVRGDIDLPQKNQIVDSGKLRLGAHFAPLARYADRLSFLNGVQVGTANHETGLKQFVRLKTNVSERMPGVLDIIGRQRRQDQPIAAIHLNMFHRVLHTPSFFGNPDRFYYGERTIWEAMAEADKDQLASMASVMKRESASLRRRGALSREGQVTAEHLDDVAAFFTRMTQVEPFVPTQVADDYVAQSMAESMQRTVWLLENDLTCGVLIDVGLLGWDTHQRNDARQSDMNGNFVKHFSWFLDALGSRKNQHGVLADTTAVVGGSDLGRFPRLNDMLGKDHLPQTAFFFSGPGIAAGQVFGQTGTEMEARPISLSTGRVPQRGGGREIILDDVGTTLMVLAGLDPQRYGYTGAVLDFLLT
ncbi:MAG TPA: DUF1501 domain-containing protein [Kofleriaceae bacterium]|nr:DUF1501 domain-containing protein [Kofleriaceae bacterium]